MLIPLGLAVLLAAAGHPWAALLFVLFCGAWATASWSQEAGYTSGLWLLLGMSSAAVAALMLAQRKALALT